MTALPRLPDSKGSLAPYIFNQHREGLAAMLAVDAALEDGSIPLKTLELVRLRCSVRNACVFCSDLHRTAALRTGATAVEIEHVIAWRDPMELAPGNRAALQFCDAFARLDDDGALRRATDAVREQFGERGLATLAFATAQIEAWNRLAALNARIH